MDRGSCPLSRWLVPAEVSFRTKPQLARVLLERALAAGVPASWVTADEADGGDPALRVWLEDRGISYALAVKGTERLATATPGSVTAAQLAAAGPGEQWVACSAGHGAKGRRLDDWPRIQLAAPASAGDGAVAAVRRRRRDGELACYACWGPASTSLVGSRWRIEEGFQQAKTEVGLDHHQVRRWPGWYRHVTLALLAHAVLVVTRTTAATGDGAKGGRGGLTSQLCLLPLTVPEVRRLLVALAWTAPIRPGSVLAWSRWRRRHQARARRAHDQRREPQARLEQ